MQVLNVEGFEQRILFNAAKQYSSQLMQGEHYRLLNPVIALTFTDFVLFKDAPAQVLSRFKLMEKQRLVDYGDDIELVLSNCPNFSSRPSSLTASSSAGFSLSKTPGNSTSSRKPSTRPRQAFDIINEAGMSADELEAQHKRRDFIILQRDALAKARSDGEQAGLAKGMEIGVEQGIEQGIEQGWLAERNALIAQAHRAGLAPQLIASLVGMTEAELALQLQTLGL